ncbi:hypothetical protein CMQ_1409 [Grosmannia clavigera kw1407]|uniref:Subtilisin-like serine protease n=1 Tax=Grosmannia clavigera (strain kw1407 / UAMH 11150) TaxID=655863 RepID=F0XDC6_GROCL|nr:uncharacterized protein CMQ_1409 [Grosmannia clavigera kw1407]EFX04481.1 hypothetical protein CMQ_1409 [Grosmannia clavigera kw1407]
MSSDSFHSEPPFSVDVLHPADGSARPPLESLLPGVYREAGQSVLTVPALTAAYLTAELDLGRLDDYSHHWFWLLDSPALPRPLHDCRHKSRVICLTERLDRHLGLGLSAGGGGSAKQTLLFVKPLPRLLLDVRFWQMLSCNRGDSSHTHAHCPKHHLWECALGFLYSYAALVPCESDFRLAQHHGLLPAEVAWTGWRVLVGQVATCADVRGRRFHQRFRYGELWLHRLREMAQLRRGGLLPVLVGRLDRIGRFFQDNVRSLASLVAYMAVVLSALQTGLTTVRLADSAAFQSLAAGFTVFALVGPLAVVLGCALYFGASLLYHVAVHFVTGHLRAADGGTTSREDLAAYGHWDEKSEV